MRFVGNEILDHGELSFQNVIEILAIINESRWGEVEINANGTTLKFTRTKVRKSHDQGSVGQISLEDNQSEKTDQVEEGSQVTDQYRAGPDNSSPGGEKENRLDLEGATPVYPPMAGIFYSASAPGAPKFVEVGDHVSEGQQLGIVEVMKLFTPVVSPCAGMLRKILVANEAFVENDQVIMLVEADSR
jgi:biotin carboxyl carrier protein